MSNFSPHEGLSSLQASLLHLIMRATDNGTPHEAEDDYGMLLRYDMGLPNSFAWLDAEIYEE
jgi:hypothetical protein